MRMLVDTQILIWAAFAPSRLSKKARRILQDEDNEILFSPASLWEIALKSGLNRPDFQVDAQLLLRGLLDNGYEELAVASVHALEIANLPPLHKDPFDRILLAQAKYEGIGFLTADRMLIKYPLTAIVAC